jgi:hypothetical protein
VLGRPARPGEAIDLARAAQAAALKHGSATLLTECLVMEAHGHAARNDARKCGTALATAERSFDRATQEDSPAWLAYFDEAYLAARMAQCFRDLGEAGHAARYARRSLDMDGRYVRGRAFNLALLATACAAQDEPKRRCRRPAGPRPDRAPHLCPQHRLRARPGAAAAAAR